MKTETLHAALRHLLYPLVRLLQQKGLPWAEFADIAKQVYVQVARNETGKGGKPGSDTRVSAATGISRREVARLRVATPQGSGELLRHGERIARIMTAWHLDSEFTDGNGKPAPLPATGAGSLDELLARHGGGLPTTELTAEMLNHGLVRQRADGRYEALRRDYVFRDVDPEIVLQLGVALHDHAATLGHNLDPGRSGRPRFEGIAESCRVAAAAIPDFEAFVESRGLEFLQDADNWLAANEPIGGSMPDQESQRVGVGIYLIKNDPTASET